MDVGKEEALSLHIVLCLRLRETQVTPNTSLFQLCAHFPVSPLNSGIIYMCKVVLACQRSCLLSGIICCLGKEKQFSDVQP